nr:MAG TPA: hypothetical protein [Caudoviricetes sp.]
MTTEIKNRKIAVDCKIKNALVSFYGSVFSL